MAFLSCFLGGSLGFLRKLHSAHLRCHSSMIGDRSSALISVPSRRSSVVDEREYADSSCCLLGIALGGLRSFRWFHWICHLLILWSSRFATLLYLCDTRPIGHSGSRGDHFASVIASLVE
jgi:hypothetical protein